MSKLIDVVALVLLLSRRALWSSVHFLVGKFTGRFYFNLSSIKWYFLQQIGVGFGGKMKMGENA